MSTRAQKIRLGVFMILALLIFLGSVGTLAGIKMFNPRDRYKIRFKESVSGLEVGSTVKMKGVRVGQVEKIRIAEDVESVEVTLALEPGTPITRDTRAIMSAIGITGLQFVELTGGSARSPRIPPNTDRSYIKPGASTLQTLTGKAESIAIKMEAVLNNLLRITGEGNQVRVRNLLEHADRLAVTSEAVVSENRQQIRHIIAGLDHTARALEKGANRLRRLVDDNSDLLSQALAAASGAATSLDRAIRNVNPQGTLKAITGAARSLRRRVDDPRIGKLVASLDGAAGRLSALTGELARVVRDRNRQLGAIMKNLDRASGYLKDFSRAIKERPSLLLRGETVKEKDLP